MANADQQGIFISWSKPRAEQIATLLKPFLEDVLGTATIFMSRAMEGGTRWGMEIPQQLESCKAGLVLVTHENSHEPWLHFEAGALSKHIEESRVVPLLCGARVGHIQGTPLSLFQAKDFKQEDFLSVCISFGAGFGVSEGVIQRRFAKGWPELEASVAAIDKSTDAPSKEIALADVMGVLERLASQVASLENGMRALSAMRVAGRIQSGTLGDANSRWLQHLTSAAEGGEVLKLDEAHRLSVANLARLLNNHSTVTTSDDQDKSPTPLPESIKKPPPKG